jgi:formylglycine-generating enzyme required for sulfatase activity
LVPERYHSVEVPSFLIFRYPVTNDQFWKFLKTERGKAARSEVHGVEIHNDYYLDGWRPIKNRIDRDITSLSPSEIAGIDPLWMKKPVVTVNHMMASEFARAYGLELPSELQYEAAARMVLPDGLFSDAKSYCHNWPWPEESAEGFCIFAQPDDKYNVPDWTVDEYERGTNSQRFAQLDAWLKALDVNAAYVPRLLVDGIREWCSNSWVSDLSFDKGSGTSPGWREDPKYDLPTKSWFESSGEEKDSAQLTEFTVRGGSFLRGASMCRISMRAPQAGKHCNPDTGFRCIRMIIPSPKVYAK